MRHRTFHAHVEIDPEILRSQAMRRSPALVLIWLGLLFAALQAVQARGVLTYRPDSRHAGLWRSLYANLPNRWKTRDAVKVGELGTPDMNAVLELLYPGSVARGERLAGLYRDPAREITLAEDMSDEDARETFLHEYGHYVWYHRTTAKERHDYARIWKAHRSAPVSLYAANSCLDGFAEAFAYFNGAPDELQAVDGTMYRFFAGMSDGNRNRMSTLSRY
jgi:hypothetical protein